MTNPIKRHFIERDSLPELEEALNSFTNNFNPADVLEVAFYVGAKGVTIHSEEIKNMDEKTGDEEQHIHEKFIVMVTYNDAKPREVPTF